MEYTIIHVPQSALKVPDAGLLDDRLPQGCRMVRVLIQNAYELIFEITHPVDVAHEERCFLLASCSVASRRLLQPVVPRAVSRFRFGSVGISL